MKIFFDTNVLVSAFYFNGNERKVLKFVIDNEIEGVISPQVITETRKIMIKKFKEKNDDVDNYIQKLLSVMKFVNDFMAKIDIKHEKDKNILGSALISNCEYLITGDHHLI